MEAAVSVDESDDHGSRGPWGAVIWDQGLVSLIDVPLPSLPTKRPSVSPRKKAEVGGHVRAMGRSTSGRATCSFKERPRQRTSIRKSYFIDLSIRRVRALACRDAACVRTSARERRNVGEEPKRKDRRPHTHVQRWARACVLNLE